MLCPKCHNDNPIQNDSCDFCMFVIPMTPERQKKLEELNKIVKKDKYQKSVEKICGLLLGLGFIILIVVIGLVFF